MKISFITTVFNEEKTIERFFESLFSQTRLPDEIIVVDGGSKDLTLSVISNFQFPISNKNVKILTKKGNRSVGRNEAIRNATGDIIVCSDAGNILDKKWIENIIKPFLTTKTSYSTRPHPDPLLKGEGKRRKRRGGREGEVDVVAGYYKGLTKNIFQKSLVPYVLVMPDKVDPNNFHPATRSIAFRKTIWKEVGGFNESLSHNEDYAFARRLKEIGARIVFARDAIAYWLPRDTYKQAFIMFFRFALGDSQAGIIRTKVILLFARYFIWSYLLFLCTTFKSYLIFIALLLTLFIYILWSINKNYRYIKEKKAFIILPLLQFIADLAVLSGTILGLVFQILKFIKQNKLLTSIILLYSSTVVLMLGFGTPNESHPFPYHMDEWHQLAAIKAIIKHRTTTISGVAQIPFLYPMISGIYLLPFIILHIINPFSLKSPLDDLLMQERLFEILRSVNIWFGLGSILLISKIARTYLKVNTIIPAFFFALSPVLLMLSGYFKYDISLLFFIILTLTLLFKFAKNPTSKNYIYASITGGLALATKFSAIPLLPLITIAPLIFKTGKKEIYHIIFLGVIAYSITFLITGVPNILIGKADYKELLYSNLMTGPQETESVILPAPWWIYLPLKEYPYLFGHFFYFLGIAAFIYLFFFLLTKSNWRQKSNKNIIFLMISFILFIISLIPLKIGAIGNRVLVLLPFLSLIIGIFASHIYNASKDIYKYILIILIMIAASIQILESAVWIYTKIRLDPQKEASIWIQKNIPSGSIIGIENIPIYQQLPNIIVKEFYLKQYQDNKTKYKYEVIDSNSSKLPSIIVISNDNIVTKLFKVSAKKLLVERLERERYKKISIFSPDFTYYKLIADDKDYYLSSLIAAPATISIYKKP